MSLKKIGLVVPDIIGDLRFRQYTSFRIIARPAFQGVEKDLVFGMKIICKEAESGDLWLDGRIHASEICDKLGGSHRAMSLCKGRCDLDVESQTHIPLVERLDSENIKSESATLMCDLAIKHMARRGSVEISTFSDSEFELCMFYGKHTLISRFSFDESGLYLFLT